MKPVEVYNWSRFPRIQARVHSFSRVAELRKLLADVPKLIARGTGLSYGDASLSSEVLSTLHFNKILQFDRDQGTIRCESGVTLDDILLVIVPAGWFLPVTPGTKFVTIGGAVAADVHGKNHHKEGSFSRYITNLSVMVADGTIIPCNSANNRELFDLTCGGMGLSGVIVDVEIQLKRIETSMIKQKNIIAGNLQELLAALETNNHFTYSVAWIDCLSSGLNMGRGVLMLGEHATLEELSSNFLTEPLLTHKKAGFNVPVEMPAIFLNPFTTSLFNGLFYLSKKLRRKEFLTHYDTFFYPLDAIKHWNRLYGKEGFLQYQFVIPFHNGEKALADILAKITESKLASFLAVLKVLGQTEHPLSFGMPGYTLALDFPISPGLFVLLEDLDRRVADFGGKLYLAKDARMDSTTFKRGYPLASDVKARLTRLNGDTKFESLLSQRLSITA